MLRLVDHKLRLGEEATVSTGFRDAAILFSLSVLPDLCSQLRAAGGQEG